ncbi:hypothetical protein M011DRAFT_494033 [Sporormia fimetaria CBS 119925]|uniref:DUF8035 domain-containing protein n=1 Tax=Sporormia fimetaria CBS 119925 TaxID=1340428 RepID=A0A6A6VF47_9PLEO|nr:hypothetical protein M011DRAFT_494033 [Sporormia fimetaria CBS 119925]
MSRRYPTAELYEERQRDFYGNRHRSDRSYDELDLELSRGANPRRSAPDFSLREDYGRSSAGPLVRISTRDDDVVSSRSSRGGRREVEEDALVIRGGRTAPPPAASVREVEREDITIRRSEGERRRPREVERDETDISIRRREQSRPRMEVREVERDDIIFRRGDGTRPRPREVDVEREEIRFRARDPPARETEREEIIFRHEHRDDDRGREPEYHKDTFVIRGRERSLPPPSRKPELVAREREEFVVRRREPSPAPREIIKDEIIIRRKEEQRVPTPEPTPPPPPPPQPEIRPPIIQEIITHHRHIDHGVERARSPTPPPPPSPPRDETLEIAIRRRDGDDERATDYGLPSTSSRKKDMWTEITKDLVLKDAIDAMGYDYEETDYFFYVMEYLRYEDVLQLVEISDDIRRRRKSRIREIEFEREEIRAPKPSYDERFYEREISYDRHRRRYG